jgi:hypothetical protein
MLQIQLLAMQCLAEVEFQPLGDCRQGPQLVAGQRKHGVKRRAEIKVSEGMHGMKQLLGL